MILDICDNRHVMANYSTRQAAKQLGVSHATLARYVESGKISKPQMVTTGITTTHIWSDVDIERVRQLLPKITNGRKTRWKKQSAEKKQLAASNKQLAKPKVKTKKKSKPRSPSAG